MNDSLPRLLTFYFRILILLVIVTIGVSVIFAGARQALAADIKTVSMISGDLFTVGDVFNGVTPDKANHVLGPAPQPGQDMVLNARMLLHIARALDLPWHPQNTTDQVVLRRAATVVSEQHITSLLKKHLVEKGVNGRFDVHFAGSLPQIVLPEKEAATIELDNVRFDPHNDRFEATIYAPSKQNALTEAIVSGNVMRIVEVPVLRGTLQHGQIIGARDINWLDMYSHEIQHDIVLDEDILLGMTPRRMILTGKPMRDNELEYPRIVNRGEFVTLIYQSGPIELTAKGKALEDGAKGDFVRIVNINSKRTLEGYVSAEHEVTVTQ